VRPRRHWPALLCGPSTSPLGFTVSAFVYHDLAYSDFRPEVRVRATVTLLGSAERGRTSKPAARWRPNHNFGAADGRTFYIGQVEFDSGDAIEPGESRNVLIRFIDGPGLREALCPGRSWRIQEGPTIVGTATVTEVLGET
jgi:translation elongation factor EF-Tu-like GTPase